MEPNLALNRPAGWPFPMERVVLIQRASLEGVGLRIQFQPLSELTGEQLKQLESKFEGRGEKADVGMHTKTEYLIKGATVIVDAGVSRDLEMSTAAGGTLPDIPMLAVSVLFKWEDRTLPETLLYLSKQDGRAGILGLIDSTDSAADGSPGCLFFHFTEAEFPSFMAGDQVSEDPGPGSDVLPLSAGEAHAVRYLMRLASIFAQRESTFISITIMSGVRSLNIIRVMASAQLVP